MIPLELRYKGDRNYLQGGDIVQFLEDNLDTWLEGDGWWLSRLAFRRFARNQLDLVWEAPGDQRDAVAEGLFRRNGNDRRFWLTESDRPVAGRYPFDEDALVAGAHIDGETREATLAAPEGFRPIEAIVALTKKLNYVVTPDVEGKWVFGQIQLEGPLPRQFRTLGITMKSAVAGRFSVNRIDMDGRKAGVIRFIVGAP